MEAVAHNASFDWGDWDEWSDGNWPTDDHTCATEMCCQFHRMLLWNSDGIDGFVPKLQSPLADICPVSESRGWLNHTRRLLLVIIAPQMIEPESLTQTHIAQ